MAYQRNYPVNHSNWHRCDLCTDLNLFNFAQAMEMKELMM